MKKTYIFFVLLLGLGLWGCQKDEPTPWTIGFADSLIVMTNAPVNLIASEPTLWRLLQNGRITNISGSTFTTPNTAGFFTLQAVKTADTTQKQTRVVIVTPLADLFTDIRRGGYAIVFRHASAADGTDVFNSTLPQWWKSCDNKVARQLSTPIGYDESRNLGRAIRRLKLPIGKVMSSEFCRCFTTAQLMQLGMVEQHKDLTYYVYDESNRYDNMMKLIAQQPINATNVLMVGHAGFSRTPNPAPLATLGWSDAAIFKLQTPPAAPLHVKTVTYKEWEMFK